MKRQLHDIKVVSTRSKPIEVAIVLPQRHWAGSVLLARELLLVAGTLGARSEDVRASAIFDVRLMGLSMQAVDSFGGLSICPDATIATADPFDVVVVPAQFAPVGEASDEDQRFAVWLTEQHRRGAVLLSLGGAVLVAKSGLLDGREATGLVSERALFSRYFPLVRYKPSRRIVADNDIITVCGISPTVDACAHLIERFAGIALARRFLRHTSPEAMPAQEHLALWSARFKRHGDTRILAAQEAIEREVHELPTLDQISKQAGMSERTLSRRFASATGFNLRQYVAALRLELAEYLVRSTATPLAHVAQECGFGSASALSRAFSARFGKGPGQYRADSRPNRRAGSISPE